jgi:hypothetical protein
MVDSFNNVHDVLRMMEATIGNTINDKPLYDKDVPIPTATICSPSKLIVAVDGIGPFSNPFAAVDATSGMEQRVPSLSFAEKIKICPETWSHGKFQVTRHNVGKETVKYYYCNN